MQNAKLGSILLPAQCRVVLCVYGMNHSITVLRTLMQVLLFRSLLCFPF